MPSPIFLGGKVLQERINVLEDELHQERLLSARNALAEIQAANLVQEWLDWFESGEPRYKAPVPKESNRFVWEDGDVRIIKHGTRH